MLLPRRMKLSTTCRMRDQARGRIQPAVAAEADKATAANVEEARYRPLGGAAIVGGVIAGGIIGGEMAGGAMQQGCRRVVERDQFGRPHMELVCPPVNQLYQSNPNRIYQGY